MQTDKTTASIRLMLGDTELQRLPLNKERITLGRRTYNDMVIDHPAVSAEHAVIVTLFNDSFLEDLNSTNGTLVNGQPVKKHFLQDGDVIGLANYSVCYHSEPRITSSAATVNPPQAVAGFGATASPAILSDGPPAAAQARATLRVLNGAGAGREMALTKALTSLGRPGVQVAVILSRPDGYCLTHIEGDTYPLLNGQSVGTGPHPLQDGDVLNLSGTDMRFNLQ